MFWPASPSHLATPQQTLHQSMAPGSLSLNLRGVRPDDAPGFHAAVSDLAAKCVTVPVTTKSLSEKFKFSPKKVLLPHCCC